MYEILLIIIIILSILYTIDNKPLNIVIDFILIIINISILLFYIESHPQGEIDISFFSFILIIIYASALAILFGLIMMLFNNIPPRQRREERQTIHGYSRGNIYLNNHSADSLSPSARGYGNNGSPLSEGTNGTLTEGTIAVPGYYQPSRQRREVEIGNSNFYLNPQRGIMGSINFLFPLKLILNIYNHSSRWAILRSNISNKLGPPISVGTLIIKLYIFFLALLIIAGISYFLYKLFTIPLLTKGKEVEIGVTFFDPSLSPMVISEEVEEGESFVLPSVRGGGEGNYNFFRLKPFNIDLINIIFIEIYTKNYINIILIIIILLISLIGIIFILI